MHAEALLNAGLVVLVLVVVLALGKSGVSFSSFFLSSLSSTSFSTRSMTVDDHTGGSGLGWPMSGAKVTLVDGAFHPNDSSATAFERVAREATVEAFAHAGVVLLEPRMMVDITTPDDFVGAVIGDLNARRGTVVSSDSDKAGHAIVAHVPLATMFGYVGTLRSLSRGRATFSMVLDHYGEVPKTIADDLRAAC